METTNNKFTQAFQDDLKSMAIPSDTLFISDAINHMRKQHYERF